MLASGVLKGSVLTLVIVGALALGAMVAFGQLFWWFHQIAFGLFLGDWYYWIPGPGWRYLNVMFPQDFGMMPLYSVLWQQPGWGLSTI